MAASCYLFVVVVVVLGEDINNKVCEKSIGASAFHNSAIPEVLQLS